MNLLRLIIVFTSDGLSVEDELIIITRRYIKEKKILKRVLIIIRISWTWMQYNTKESHARKSRTAFAKGLRIVTNKRNVKGKTCAITAENPDTRLRNTTPSHRGYT